MCDGSSPSCHSTVQFTHPRRSLATTQSPRAHSQTPLSPYSLNKGETRRSTGSRNVWLRLLTSHPFMYSRFYPSPPPSLPRLLVGPLASLYDRSLGLLRFARAPERWVAWNPNGYSLGGVVVSMRLLAAAVRVSSRLQRPSGVVKGERELGRGGSTVWRAVEEVRGHPNHTVSIYWGYSTVCA